MYAYVRVLWDGSYRSYLEGGRKEDYTSLCIDFLQLKIPSESYVNNVGTYIGVYILHINNVILRSNVPWMLSIRSIFKEFESSEELFMTKIRMGLCCLRLKNCDVYWNK